MNIINKLKLNEFSKRYPDASELLNIWFWLVEKENWDSPKDALACFPAAELNRDGRITIPIRRKLYYLIIAVHYSAKIVDITAIGSFSEPYINHLSSKPENPQGIKNVH